ncbi:MAG: hypothetical protein H6741_34140 [Alphaproteobacteria bacterium]|nr:hypothetical protein [Alphaproteobacteria bacterium]
MKIEFDKELKALEQDLEEGDDLAAFQEEQRQSRLAEERRKRSIGLGIGFIVVLGIIGVIVGREDAPDHLPEDLSAEWSHVAPFTEVHFLDGGLIGVLPMRWEGDAEAACDNMLAEAGLEEGHTVTLLSGEGLVMAECGG